MAFGRGHRAGLGIGALLAATLMSTPARAEEAVDLAATRAEQTRTFADDLAALADWAAKQGLAEQAQRTRAWQPTASAGRQILYLVSEGPPPAAAKDEPAAAAQWRTRFEQLRNEHSAKLVALMDQAAKQRQFALAYELAHQACRENPADERLRKLLGYQKYEDAWYRPWTIRKLKAGSVWRDELGWVLSSHLEKVDAGQRYFQGRWLSPADEAQRRKEIDKGWQVGAEHYTVTTNLNQRSAVALAERLEKFQAAWRQLFVGYLATDKELSAMFASGRPLRQTSQQHKVIYFATREQYNEALRQLQPRIDITLGIYFDTLRQCYFFAGDEQDAGTLFHEAAHQLFQETRPVAAGVGRAHNFWALEGVACYLESIEEGPDWIAVGGRDAGRMPAARQRLLVDNNYLPLAELTALGLTSLQEHADLPRLYTESAGLATFFMQAEQGRYREPWVRYLTAIYTGRATPTTLAELTDQSYEELDRQYRAFLEKMGPP
jgi:hypothetical protein